MIPTSLGRTGGNGHATLDHRLEFGRLLDSRRPSDDSELADLIEQDGRWRLERGLACDLRRYREAVPDLPTRPVSLDAAIDVSLRSLARRDGCPAPLEKHAECLLRSYPDLAGPIRLAALLGNQLLSTGAIGGIRMAPTAVALPRSIGPEVGDGRRRYELLKALGRGSSGQVFEAVDHLLSDSGHAARVAVKLIAVDDFTVHRQAAEATKARRIEHPGVARVLDRGLTDTGELFLVYELVAGGDLQAWFEARSRRADLRVVARLVADIARGVQAAHSVGVVHCDLKPSNVLVTPDGQARVTDFGVAAITDAGAAGGSGAGTIPLGNLAFAAPEQVRQNMASASPLVDVYALGGLLFYLATGEFPNGQTAEEVLRAHDPASAGAPAVTIRSRRGDADTRLDRICARAMSPKAEDRYATAAEMAADLEAWLDHRPIAWMRDRLPVRLGLWMRRSPVAAVLVIVCMVAMVGGSFVSGYFAREAEVARAKGAELERSRKENSRRMLAMMAWLDVEGREGKKLSKEQALKELQRLFKSPGTLDAQPDPDAGNSAN